MSWKTDFAVGVAFEIGAGRFEIKTKDLVLLQGR